jgi:hypothetical protein
MTARPVAAPATRRSDAVCRGEFGRDCDRIRAVDKRRLTRSNGQLAAADLLAVEDGLRRVLLL